MNQDVPYLVRSEHIRMSNSIATFKRKLKLYLFELVRAETHEL